MSTPLIDRCGMIHSAAQDLEVDITAAKALDGQAFFLFSEREAARVSLQCFKRFGWCPAVVLSDIRLPVSKGMIWLGV